MKMVVCAKLKQMFPFGFYDWIAVSQHRENIKWQAGIKDFYDIFRPIFVFKSRYRLVFLLVNNQRKTTQDVFFRSRPNLPFEYTNHRLNPAVPTCVKTLRDRRRLDQISIAKFACYERVQILKLEFSLPVWLKKIYTKLIIE